MTAQTIIRKAKRVAVLASGRARELGHGDSIAFGTQGVVEVAPSESEPSSSLTDAVSRRLDRMNDADRDRAWQAAMAAVDAGVAA